MASVDKLCKIKNADMPLQMQEAAMNAAKRAMQKYNLEQDISSFIKDEFDRLYHPTWHCIVGRCFGSYVTHEEGCFVYFYAGQTSILLFKSSAK